MELVYKYQPKDQDELIDIMNHLADRLKDSSASVTLSTCKVFMKFVEYDSDLLDQVILKIRVPILHLITIPSMEMRFIAVSHINNLIQRGTAKYFYDNFKSFFCQADDLSYIQNVKLDILVKLANQDNLFDILNELGEYSSDIDAYLSKAAVKTLGKLGYKFPDKIQYIVKQLSYFIKISKTHLLDEITIAFKLILSSSSTHPDASAIFQYIPELFQHTESEEAKVPTLHHRSL